MRGTKTVMVRNNNIHSVRRRRASKQSKTLLRLQRAQFNLISKVHYYKHKREGEGKTQSKRDRERDRGGLDGKFEQREIFFGLQSFSFYDRTELVLACGPSHQSQVCSCSCEQSAIRNPQSSSALASAAAACRCRCHHVHCISLSTWHPACNFLVVKLCFASVFAFLCLYLYLGWDNK